MGFSRDLVIIGGCGRVGFPLGLAFAGSGLEVALYLASSLRDMIYIVRGDVALARAIADGRLEVLGTARARRALRAWLNLGPLAKVRSQRPGIAA